MVFFLVFDISLSVVFTMGAREHFFVVAWELVFILQYSYNLSSL